MNVLIVDDEPLAQEVLESYIVKIPELKKHALCNNALEAFDYLNENQVDLIFLDIQMPQISGIEFLKTLQNPPKVIFTTAFQNYAFDAFELNVLDYLLKPFSFERFNRAIEKYRELSKFNIENNELQKENATDVPDFIFVKANKKLIKIKFEEIFFVEGLKDYVIIHTPSGRIVTLHTIKSLESRLPANIFKRVHRSYIVNSQLVDSVEGNALKIKDKLIPIGKNYKDDILNIINQHRL
jgi:DNA-binding LytR/AlgR family response regulator